MLWLDLVAGESDVGFGWGLNLVSWIGMVVRDGC